MSTKFIRTELFWRQEGTAILRNLFCESFLNLLGARRILKIDCHTHVGCYRDIQWLSEYVPWGEVIPKALIGFLDSSIADKAVVLPIAVRI